MREILFKAQRLDNKEWVYGYFYKGFIKGKFYIIEIKSGGDEIEIIPETVCQFTGVLDKSGDKIFEGDLLRFPAQDEWDKKNFTFYEVYYHTVGFKMNRVYYEGSLCGGSVPELSQKTIERMINIGNVFENPELLEEQR
jgi:uncharacterized phage protein (TIGR01671 family)